MALRVIVPPDPIVTPADIAGDHAADDAAVAAMIAAVTEDIDGPSGWLNRSLGPQTLEYLVPYWENGRLPCGPIIEVEAISYFDSDGVDQTVDGGDYSVDRDFLWFRSGWSAPALECRPWPVRIQYRAGYDGEDPPDGSGSVPERAKQAIILAVQHLKSLSTENLFVRSVEVPDVISKQYTVSDQASALIRRTTDRLLAGLVVYR